MSRPADYCNNVLLAQFDPIHSMRMRLNLFLMKKLGAESICRRFASAPLDDTRGVELVPAAAEPVTPKPPIEQKPG
jgi:hypothetical protein